jgi:hypothetical protein
VAEVGKAGILGPDQFTPGSQVLADQVLIRHWYTTIRLPPRGSWPCHYQDRQISCARRRRVQDLGP